MGLRLLHSGDFHLDSPFRGFDRERRELIAHLEDKMRKAAKMLEYEIAAELRDEIIKLRGEK